jgi:hypothetical protein
MRIVASGLLLTILAGCGVDETVYIPEFANLYCQRTMDCEDNAVLVFEGFATLDDCLAVIGPEIEAEVSGCKFKGKAAKKCLNAMEKMTTCWPDDSTLDDNLPQECAEVLVDCALGRAATTGSTSAGTTGEATMGGTGA